MGDLGVSGTSGDVCFESFGIDTGEIKEGAVEWAVEMVFAIGFGKEGTAFIESASGDDVSCEEFAGAAREGGGEILSEEFQFFGWVHGIGLCLV